MHESLPSPALNRADLRVPYLRTISLQNGSMLGLLLADVAGLAIAWKGAEWFAFRDPAAFVRIWALGPDVGLYWIALVLQIVLSTAAGLYRYGDGWRDVGKQLRTTALVFLTVLLVAFMYRSADGLPRSLFAIAWVGSTGFTLCNRWIAHRLVESLWRRDKATVPVLLLAHADEVREIRQGWQLKSGYRVVKAQIAPRRSRKSDRLPVETGGQDSHLGKILAVATVAELWQQLQVSGARELHVSESCYQRMTPAELWQLRGLGKVVRIVPQGLRPKHPSARNRSFGGVQTVEFIPPILSGLDFWVKRVFDVCAATVLCFLLAPLLIAIAVWIRLDSPGPILFRQQRVGLSDRPFKIVKFRTMAIDAEQRQQQLEARNASPDGILFKIKRDPRITRAGSWLRRTSLDELPQLWNVLRGEMSLVGPRPLPLRDVKRFQPWHHARHQVLPGITGLWQVRGRGQALDFDDAMALDLEYIQQWSLGLDIRLLWLTVWVVLSGKGAY
ncbi:sugar transferase [Synechococcus sp. PCC 7336]|uniref:sugar transferase n=1 Tax=Synechococcus sp. PCC 7336 TaxID=195250 RepID=UPI00035D39A4|nr:sugar transferase [Synechococcus sp. PCC 7336]